MEAAGIRMPVTAVLLDIGGTLWPERWPSREADDALRLERLRATLPLLSDARARDLLAELSAGALALDRELQQNWRMPMREALRRLDLPADAAAIRALRSAMCLPASGRIDLFPGARELLATINGLGLTCVVVSNAVWRDTQAYQLDFADLGVADRIDAVVSSVDAGYRKPHPIIFDQALHKARCEPRAAVMIGNSEAKDIEPALALGMRAIRVAIEEPLPARSAAHAVARSLDEVTATLRAWDRASRHGTLSVHEWERR